MDIRMYERTDDSRWTPDGPQADKLYLSVEQLTGASLSLCNKCILLLWHRYTIDQRAFIRSEFFLPFPKEIKPHN